MKTPTISALSLLTAFVALLTTSPLFAQTGDSEEWLPVLKPFKAAVMSSDSIANAALPRLKTFAPEVIALLLRVDCRARFYS